MRISRKQFIKSGVVITGGILLSGHKYFSRFDDQPEGFKTIRGNFGIYTERGGTMGWYVTNDSVIVIDSQFPESAEHFYNGLKTKTSRKIDFLINTHHLVAGHSVNIAFPEIKSTEELRKNHHKEKKHRKAVKGLDVAP